METHWKQRTIKALFAGGFALAFADSSLAAGAPGSFVGSWSLDGTCASGDGMSLSADGKASYDEWGAGLWALADKGTRVVLIVEGITEEADRRKTATLVEFKVTGEAGNKLMLTRLSDGAKIVAVRCKST